jgi:hypothetical protein
MNLRKAILLLGLPVVVVAADPERMPAPRPRLTEELRRQAKEATPSADPRSSSLIPGDETLGTMDYTVVGGDHGMVGRPNGPSPGSRPFDLREGGTFWSREGTYATAEAMVQYDAPNAGWDLLRITW